MKFWLYHFPVILIACVILTLSSIPRLNPPDLGLEFQDKIFHVIAYLALGITLCHSASAFYSNFLSQALFSIGIGLPFAALDELHQAFIPGRLASVFDFMADGLGILLAILFYLWFIRGLIKRILLFFY